MQTRNARKALTSGQSSDCAEPAPAGPSSDPAPVVRPIIERRRQQEEFACRAPGCNRVFTSLTGRGVHENRMHKDWYDEQQMVKLREKNQKLRWTIEEKKLLARKESDIIRSEGTVEVLEMNRKLAKVFTLRTEEAIKSRRRRPSHRERVQEYLEENPLGEDDSTSMSGSNEDAYASADDTVSTAQEDPGDPISEYFRDLAALVGDICNAQRLNTICSMTQWRSKEEVLIELSLYLVENLPRREVRVDGERRIRPEPRNRKERRRAEYARVQDLWKKGPSNCIRRILEGQLQQTEGVPKDQMYPYWNAVLTKEDGSCPDLVTPVDRLGHLWQPIEANEIKRAFPPAGTAVGPDGINVKTLRSIPLSILERIFNLFMFCGELPESLCKSRTIFLPKKEESNEPGDFRPITISSVIVRTFHKVLANRLKCISLDERQRGFRDTDGCSDNTMLLDMVLRYHRSKFKSMFMASIDMRKAFDSVTFEAVRAALRAKALPEKMVNYIMKSYDKGLTVLQHSGWESDPIHPTCGVKQGDPLSPTVFNFIVDEMLRRVPDEIGVELDGMKINVLAYADDLILVASTQVGLQELLNETTSFLSSCGLQANASKCLTVSIKNIPKEKKTVVDSKCTFKIGRNIIQALKRTDEWKYLGIPFTPEGKAVSNIKDLLENRLQVLTKAPLKPQQRLWAVRNIVIPGTLYLLTLGGVTFGYLRTIDRMLRKYVRAWIHLPHDCPNAYIHASIVDGGLGIPSVRWRAPVERANRLAKLARSSYLVGDTVNLFLLKEITSNENRLKDENNEIIRSNEDINKFWARRLYASVDGGALKNSRKVIGQHDWVGDFTRFLSGKDYILSCKARVNALPTRSRTSRGRGRKDRACRGGCGGPETLNHVVQFCHRTHGTRVSRHDAVVKYVGKGLQKLGYAVEFEPHIRLTEDLCKPDIVAQRGVTTFIIDAQVMSEQTDLDRANKLKIEKYSRNLELIRELKRRRNCQEVKTLAVTLSLRGLWSQDSWRALTNLGFLKKKDAKVISSRVIIGTIAAWHQFNSTTAVRRQGHRPRTGIG